LTQLNVLMPAAGSNPRRWRREVVTARPARRTVDKGRRRNIRVLRCRYDVSGTLAAPA